MGNKRSNRWNEENTLSAVERFVKQNGRFPLATEMNHDNGLPSRRTFESYAGISFYEYGKAHYPELVKQGEVKHRQLVADRARGRTTWTEATLMAAVQRFAERNARLPEKSEYIPANGLPSYALFSRIAESALTDSLSKHLSVYINLPAQERGGDAVQSGFKARARELFPEADQEAMRKWLGYARELERDGAQPAADFLDKVYVELALVHQHDGSEIARQLFDAGRSFTFNPDEIRGAARLLKQGLAMKAVCQKALDGYCDPTPQERQESRDMLYSLTHSREEQKNERPEPGNSPLNKKLKSFGFDQARLIRDAVEQIVSYALKEAVPDEDELYCEVDYDLVNRCLSPLDDMGTRLSIEKLAEIVDAHPAVNYTDYHNTGITLYFNSPEILQGLGRRPSWGMADMQQL